MKSPKMDDNDSITSDTSVEDLSNIDKDTNIANDADIEHNVKVLREADLEDELKVELARLQQEYKRQKEITQELELEREKVHITQDTVVSTLPTTVGSKPEHIMTELPEYPEYSDVYTEPKFEQQYLGDINIEKRVMEKVGGIKTELAELKSKLDSKLDIESITEMESSQTIISELSNSVTKFGKELQIIQKEIEKTDLKLSAVLLDLGFDESLDLNKVPNYIFVLVYETILNDIISKILHAKGTQDTEEAVLTTLEGIRSHTSGGELFKFEHNKIKMPELRQYLDKKTISPKQIHITFNSIIEKLLEYVPRHSPKNFKAMIKLMSQEYALDTAAKLDSGFELFESRLEEFQKKINKISDKFKERDTEQQALSEELKNINLHITQMTTRFDELPGLIDESISQKLSELPIAQDKTIEDIERNGASAPGTEDKEETESEVDVDIKGQEEDEKEVDEKEVDEKEVDEKEVDEKEEDEKEEDEKEEDEKEEDEKGEDEQDSEKDSNEDSEIVVYGSLEGKGDETTDDSDNKI